MTEQAQAGQPAATPAPQAATAAPAAPAKRRFEIPADADLFAPGTAKPAASPAASAAPAESGTPAQNAGAEAPPSDEPEKAPESKPELTPEEQERRRQGRRFERRLDKAFRRAAEAEARAKILETQLNEAKGSSPSRTTEAEPTLAQFDYDPEKYAEAKAKYAKQQAEKEFTAKQSEAMQRAQREKLVSDWESKVEKGIDEYDDFTETVGNLTPDNTFSVALMHLDNGHKVAYHLGKNTKDAERIASLAPLAQVLEIGRLAERLSAQPAKPKTPSKAPAPIAPVQATGSPPSTGIEDSNLSDKEWMRRRNKEIAARRAH